MSPYRAYSVSTQPCQVSPRPRSERWPLARFSGLASSELPAPIALLGRRLFRCGLLLILLRLLARAHVGPLPPLLIALVLAARSGLVEGDQSIECVQVVGDLPDAPLRF